MITEHFSSEVAHSSDESTCSALSASIAKKGIRAFEIQVLPLGLVLDVLSQSVAGSVLHSSCPSSLAELYTTKPNIIYKSEKPDPFCCFL